MLGSHEQVITLLSHKVAAGLTQGFWQGFGVTITLLDGGAQPKDLDELIDWAIEIDNHQHERR